MAETPVYVAVTARFDGGALADATVINITLIPLASPIKAVLRGPSGNVRADSTIVLNATGSVDPDDPANNVKPMSVTWRCTREDFPNPCFTSTDMGTQRGLTWAIDASKLTAGIKHVFQANVGKDSNRDFAFTVITPTAGAIPTGRIVRTCGASCPAKHSADLPLSLSLVFDAGSTDAAVTWTWDQLTSISGFNGEGTNQAQPDLREPHPECTGCDDRSWCLNLHHE
jgi:hypothetical protein